MFYNGLPLVIKRHGICTRKTLAALHACINGNTHNYYALSLKNEECYWKVSTIL